MIGHPLKNVFFFFFLNPSLTQLLSNSSASCVGFCENCAIASHVYEATSGLSRSGDRYRCVLPLLYSFAFRRPFFIYQRCSRTVDSLSLASHLRVLYSANILGQTLDKLLDYEMYAHEDRPNNAAPPEIGVQAKTVKQRATVAWLRW